jgi:hypothetical protein
MARRVTRPTWLVQNSNLASYNHHFAINAAPPHVGFQWAETLGMHLWIHHPDFVSAAPHSDGGSIIHYSTGREHQQFHSTCEPWQAEEAVTWVRREVAKWPPKRRPHKLPPSSKLPEICAWLQQDDFPVSFVDNVFDGSENALRLFQRLYRLGAIHIGVEAREMSPQDIEPEHYARTAVIILPEGPGEVRSIWASLASDVQYGGCIIESTGYVNEFSLNWMV